MKIVELPWNNFKTWHKLTDKFEEAGTFAHKIFEAMPNVLDKNEGIEGIWISGWI